MKPNYKKHLITIGLIWAGCFALFLFVYMFLIMPHKKTRKQTAKILAEKKELYNQVMKVSAKKVRNSLEEEIQNLLNDVKKFAVDFENFADLTFDIGRIAGQKDLDNFSIKYKKKPTAYETDEHTYINNNIIDISFTGGFNQFAVFLNTLERHQPVIFIDKFRIMRSKQKDSDHKVTMNLSVLVRKPQNS